MTGKTHMIVGATAAVALSGGIPFVSLPLAVICSVIGSLIPDIDHPNSLASTANPFMRIVSFIVRKAVIPAIAVVINSIAVVIGRAGISIKDARTGHRGPITHSPLGALLWTLPVALVFGFSGIPTKFVFIGIMSHIIADMLNPQGSPFLYPFVSKNISFANIRTGSGSEYLFKIAMVGVLFVVSANAVYGIIGIDSIFPF